MSPLLRSMLRAAGSGTSQPGSGSSTGSVFYVPLPAGTLATIRVQRNGVDIPGAVSSPKASSYAYTITGADDGATLTPRLTDISYDTAAPRRFSWQINDAERDAIEFVFDKTLQSTAINLTHFVLSGAVASPKTLLSATADNNVLKLKYSSPFVFGDAPAVTLSTNGDNDLADYAGNLVPAFANLVIANNIERGVVPNALPVVGGYGNDGTNGWFAELGGITGRGWALTYMLGMQSTAVNSALEWMYADGWVEMQCPDASPALRRLSLSPGQNDNDLFKSRYRVRYQNGVLQAELGMAGDPQTPSSSYVSLGPTFTVAQPGAAAWTRVRRREDLVTVEYSINGRATWTVLYTFAFSEVDPLYAHMGLNQTGVPIVAAGLAGFAPAGSVETL